MSYSKSSKRERRRYSKSSKREREREREGRDGCIHDDDAEQRRSREERRRSGEEEEDEEMCIVVVIVFRNEKWEESGDGTQVEGGRVFMRGIVIVVNGEGGGGYY